MRLTGPVAASGAKKSRTGGASDKRARNSSSGTANLARSISSRFMATILSRIVGTLDVVHPFGRTFEALDESGKRYAVQKLALFDRDFLPRAVQDAGRGRVAGGARGGLAKLAIDDDHHVKE